MKQLSLRFFLSNVFTAIWLIVNISQLQSDNRLIWKGKDPVYGSMLLVIFFAGIFFSWVKARDLRARSKKVPGKFENFLLILFYLFAIGGNSLWLFAAVSLIFGGYEAVPDTFKNASVAVMLISFLFLTAEGYVLGNGTGKLLSEKMRKITDAIVVLYIGTGISVVWNTLILGGNVSLRPDQPALWSELIAACVLVLMMVLPFQRLFWFEVFSESQHRNDHLKIFAGLVLVLAGAIVPLFF